MKNTLLLLASLVFTDVSRVTAAELPHKVGEVLDSFHGRIYFAAKDLKTGATLEHWGGEKVQTASVIKVPILVELFAQASEARLSLEDHAILTDENRVQGSGILKDLQTGLSLTLRDLAVLMTVLSDNTATNMLIDKLGIPAVNARMREAGLRETALYKKVFKAGPDTLTEEEKKWGLGATTPREMLSLMEKIYRREIVDGASCDAMVAILKKQRDRDQVPRLLTGPRWEHVEVANKTGSLNEVRNDVALVFTPRGDVALSLFAQEARDTKWTADNEATLALARLAVAVVEHFLGSAR